MGRTRGYQPKASQPAQPPDQDQTNKQPEVVTAIGTPGNFSMTPEERDAIEESFRVAATQPCPEGDDFADEPPPKPYDPNDPRYEWAKPEAWTKEKDSEGRTVWRNRITSHTSSSRPPGVKDEEESQSAAQQHDQ